MAIFHLNYRGCSPATGAGAVRKAAYQSGHALVEERSGQLCDYARKERVVEEGLSLPGGVPPIGRGELWNGAERAWAEGGGGHQPRARRGVVWGGRQRRSARPPPPRGGGGGAV